MSDFGDTQEILQEFLIEAGDLLEDVDSKLVELESHPSDINLLNTVFRGFHTIKGGAGFLEAHSLVELCHKTENLFDLLRSGKEKLSPEMLDVILSATGEVRRMFNQMSSGSMPTSAPKLVLDNLDSAINGTIPKKSAEVAATPKPAPVENCDADIQALSKSDNINWKKYYEAVVGGPPPFVSKRVVEDFVEDVEHQQEEIDKKDEEVKPVAKAAAASNVVQSQAKDTTIRIDTHRFDQILNLSGEIGLTKNRLNCLRQELAQGKNPVETRRNLDSAIRQLDVLVSDLQTSVMKARMQPVGNVFKKYTRMARDVARNLGKDVDLIISGAETEVDKTILEELNDPLVHLVRNAVDHGIETIVERRSMGKPERGTVNLSARQEGDHIVIEINDDGRGMKAEVLRQKAVEKGCITQEQANQLTTNECLELILLPGFSTKTEVTDISGRGVGMDVVKTNIQKLNGRIEIESEPGRGSRMTISLPLTLAILPVLMLRLEQQIYSLPLSCVREIIPINERTIHEVNGRPNLSVRGTVLPIIDLADLLHRPSADCPKVGIMASTGTRTVILAVDELLGQDEVMIKPLEGIKPKGVSGATLSGEGLLVLVLDLRALMEGNN